MSPPGRPKGESLSAQREGSPMSAGERLGAAAARLGIAAINLTARWPFALRSALGSLLGDLLWFAAASRRRVALANLRACFPDWSDARRREVARQTFRNISRGVLDHAVLWQGSRAEVEHLVRVEGAQHLLNPAHRPLILLAPHFIGLDAGGLRVNTLVRGVSIYARQSNAVWDEWLLRARRRFNEPVLIPRQGAQDLRAVIRAMREGMPLYYLPDMDLGARHSIFAPFFGVAAATLPMVSKLARATGARVVMAVTERTAQGYVLHFEPPWEGFPGDDDAADTERMNAQIERWVLRLPDQYLWTHRRFKTRPPGAPSIY
jgi:Kdo2-lipid IVA lauroyltransferase/acyltransferase